MEEVDTIIFHILRGLKIDIQDDITALSQLSVELIVQSVSCCLNAIDPTLKVPKMLPSGISHRIEVASQIAATCKELGYKGEVGYQTFLYYNEADLRKVFMFLVECLPKEAETKSSGIAPSDKKSILMSNIRRKITEELNTNWIPPCCKIKNSKDLKTWISNQNMLEDEDLNKMNDTKEETVDLKVESMLKELRTKSKATSVVLSAQLSSTSASDTHTGANEEGIKHNSNKAEAEETAIAEVPLQELKEVAIKLRQKLNDAEQDRIHAEAQCVQVQSNIKKAKQEHAKLTSLLELIKQYSENEEFDPDKITLRVKNEIDKLNIASEQWDSKILSLKASIGVAQQELNGFQSERGKWEQQIENLKTIYKELKLEYQTKEAAKVKLQKDYENINKAIKKRSTYTKKIMEIIGNIAKQKIEIDKVLEDTRLIQKEINNLNGQLDRSFALADETVFRDAKRDEQSKKAYKLLATLHSECGNIVSLVNETGACSREIVDLGVQVENEKSKRVEEALVQLKLDLRQMQQELHGDKHYKSVK